MVKFDVIAEQNLVRPWDISLDQRDENNIAYRSAHTRGLVLARNFIYFHISFYIPKF